MEHKLRWAILGLGSIAAEFAEGVNASTSGVVAAVASRDADKARAFATRVAKTATTSPPVAYGRYEELIADDDIDVIYVATPHRLHEPWAVSALEAGRNVLCEKPLTVNAVTSQTVIDAAVRSGAFLMEAFMYRLHPQTTALVGLLQQGAIGMPMSASVSFGYDIGPRTDTRATRHTLAGGAILDVGCYSVSVARLVAAIAAGSAEPVEPVDVVGVARLEPGERTDVVTLGALSFTTGFLAQISCATRAHLDDAIRVHGSEGDITVPVPSWLDAQRGPGSSTIVVTNGSVRKEVTVVADRALFTYEADHIADTLPAQESPILSWAETMANMRTLDRWRSAAGVQYDFE